MATPAEEILNRLPHRPPFRFITETLELTADAGEAVWRVTGDEAFFAGHFPGAPIVPGVLIGEALAQLSGLVVSQRFAGGTGRDDIEVPTAGKLAHIDLRFSSAVAPPADILLSSRLERTLGALWQFDVSARADGERAARGGLTLAIAPAPEAANGGDA